MLVILGLVFSSVLPFCIYLISSEVLLIFSIFRYNEFYSDCSVFWLSGINVFYDLTASQLADTLWYFLNNVVEAALCTFKTLLGCRYVRADGALMSL